MYNRYFSLFLIGNSTSVCLSYYSCVFQECKPNTNWDPGAMLNELCENGIC